MLVLALIAEEVLLAVHHGRRQESHNVQEVHPHQKQAADFKAVTTF
jgi:hypothetical protein